MLFAKYKFLISIIYKTKMQVNKDETTKNVENFERYGVFYENYGRNLWESGLPEQYLDFVTY